MKDLKWIKLSVSVFENRKIKYLSRMERGALYELIWIKLLCLAGQINDGGRIYLVKRRMITPEEIADVIGMPEEVVCEALLLFDELDMIRYNQECGFVIKNYEEYQRGTTDDEYTDSEGSVGISEMTEEQRREYNREAKRRSREKKRCEKSLSNECQKGVKTDFDMSNECQNDVKNSPKNIFIEENENREEENRIDENRIEKRERGHTECAMKSSRDEDEIRKERMKSPSRDGEIFAEAKVDGDCAIAPTHERGKNFDQSFSVREANSFQGEEKSSLGEICADAPTHACPSGEKKGYGTFNNVFLYEEEWEDLKLKHPKITEELIDDFSAHLEATRKVYYNHYAVLLRWAKNEFAPKRAIDENEASDTNRRAESHKGERERGEARQRDKPEEIKKSSACEKRRYGDFDPIEAFKIALERSEKGLC